MVEKLGRDPISVGMLKINGNDIMKICSISPSPKIGQILLILLDEVLDDPKKNTKEYLDERARKLCEMSDKDLAGLAKKSKEKKTAVESEEVGKIKKKHYVK